MKRALITGITGQDGSHLAEFLIDKGYQVHGVLRRASSFNEGRIKHLSNAPFDHGPNLKLYYGDLIDPTGLQKIVDEAQPDEIYNLAAQSHVRVSFDCPEYTVDTVALGCLRMLEAARAYAHHSGKEVRFYQASSSEMYGTSPPPQNEDTPFHPRSPYACGKVYAYWQTVNYRESYGLYACNGILFNHEGPRRGENFVTRKISRAAARIKLGLQEVLTLGNLDARRDWGYAGDYVKAMWMMLQAEKPSDYVVATGESHSVREFLNMAFELLDLDPERYLKFDAKYLRPAEVDHLEGDPSKIKREIGWEPTVSFADLVKLMVEQDLEIARREKTLHDAGFVTGARGTTDSYVPF